MARVQLPAAWEKNLHASAPSAPTYVWIRGEKKHKENDLDERGQAVCGARGGERLERKCEGRLLGWSFRAFLRDLLSKLHSLLPFCHVFSFFFSNSNLPAAKDIKFKQSYFSISAGIDNLQQISREPSHSQARRTYQPTLLL